MCGICGKISDAGVDSKQITRMADAIAHRGPDDVGYYCNRNVGLGHRRLSIIDLEGGRQPLSNEDETILIVFNGEIYNYAELRKDLLQKGHRFKTNTDTEVIIHLYEELKEDCLSKLRGMFAFALWDVKAKKLFMARDRIGQKPLFYCQIGSSFLFASEVKSILSDNEITRDLDFTAMHHYLSLRFIPAPQTMFKQVKKLPAGNYLTYQNGTIRVQRYWSLNFKDKLYLKESEFLEKLETQLMDSVESHLVSDVPVGAFLSGGMDTSMIVAIMAKTSCANFKTFAIGVKEQDYNELPFARVVSEHHKTEHIERIVNADIIRLLPTMIWYLDEPSDPIAACMFHAAKLASENVKVVMGGDGGDELFAGFDRYLGMHLVDYYNLIPAFIRTKLLSPILNAIPDSFTYKSITQKMRWADCLSSFEGGERYAEATSFFRFSHKQKRDLFSEDIWRIVEDIQSSQVIAGRFNEVDSQDPIDKMLYADILTRLAEHTLMLTDRMNMAHGLEARSPFLDHPLVELLAKFPSNIKINGHQLKYILRKLGEKYLPIEILKRQKQGFMFPVAYWFRNELYNFLHQYFNQSTIIKEGFFRRDYVKRLIEDHRQNKNDNHVRIWMLLNLDIWYRLYIDGESIDSLKSILTMLI